MGLNLLRGQGRDRLLVLPDGAAVETASPVSGDLFAVITPQDIALYLERPDGSPRNVWQTHVAEIHLMGDRVRVVLDDPIRIAAEITTVALAELRLTDGSPVWASVKATQITTYPAGGALGDANEDEDGNVGRVEHRRSSGVPGAPPGGRWTVEQGTAGRQDAGKHGDGAGKHGDGAGKHGDGAGKHGDGAGKHGADAAFRVARDELLALRGQHLRAVENFHWPELGERFNWGIDWFDSFAAGSDRPGLVVVQTDGSAERLTFGKLPSAPTGWPGGSPGKGSPEAIPSSRRWQPDRAWESMLALVQLGAVIVPITTALGPGDLSDRIAVRACACIAAGSDLAKFTEVPGAPDGYGWALVPSIGSA